MSSVEEIGNRRGLKFIDCDVHPLIKSIDQLYPYMTTNWIKRLEFQNLGISSLGHPDRYAHPTGGVPRPDAAPPSGGPAGSDPLFAKEQYIDAFNPEKAVLNALQPATLVSWTDVELVNTLTSAFNDFFINEWLPVDDRYAYAVVAPPHDPVRGAEEVRRVGKNNGVCAVYLPLLNILMGNSYYYPIYEAAIEMDLPIITHVSGQEGSFLGAPVLAGGIQQSYNDRYINLTQIAQSNLSSLIFDGVFERYPSLKVAFIEYGFSWVLAMMWRMDKVWKELRIGTPWVKKFPSEYLAENILLSTQPLDEPKVSDQLIKLIEMMNGKEFLMFSSDYPHWDNDMPTRVLNGLSDDFKSRIFYKNAKNFFRF